MAYVIAVVGAGGKTSISYNLALKYANNNKKVYITTTTHMWIDFSISDIYKLDDINIGEIYYFGIKNGDKISKVSDDEYNIICELFDIVIVEADGSRMMPLKIPKPTEPVIPSNVNEIIIVMGLESIGRDIRFVCYNYNGQYDFCKNDKKNEIIVTEKIIDDIIDKYYLIPLKNKYINSKIEIIKNDFTLSDNYKKIKKIAIGILAAGFSKRYNGNKLLTKISINDTIDGVEYKNYEIYKIMFDKILLAKKCLINKFKQELKNYDINIDIAAVTQYDKIINDSKYINKIDIINNIDATSGQSSSIKLLTKKYIDYDAIIYINCDMPVLPYKEIVDFILNSICSYSEIAAFYTDSPKNPAYFEKNHFNEILEISGDVGLKTLLNKYMKTSYKYFINDEYLYDIDTESDLNYINEKYK